MDQLERQALDWIKDVLERQEAIHKLDQDGIHLNNPRGMDEDLLAEPLRTRVKQILGRQGWRV